MRDETAFDPWNRPGWTKQPTLKAYRAAWAQLDATHRAVLVGDDVTDGPTYDEALDAFLDEVTAEMLRQPVNARAGRRAQLAAYIRAAKRQVRAGRRVAIAQRLATPAPSRREQRRREQAAAAHTLQEAA